MKSRMLGTARGRNLSEVQGLNLNFLLLKFSILSSGRPFFIDLLEASCRRWRWGQYRVKG